MKCSSFTFLGHYSRWRRNAISCPVLLFFSGNSRHPFLSQSVKQKKFHPNQTSDFLSGRQVHQPLRNTSIALHMCHPCQVPACIVFQPVQSIYQPTHFPCTPALKTFIVPGNYSVRESVHYFHGNGSLISCHYLVQTVGTERWMVWISIFDNL